MMRSSVGRYLHFAVAATVLVTVLPSAGAAITYLGMDGNSQWIPALVVAAGISLAVVVVGAYLWKRRPESADVSFGELMLWRFFRRARAEEQLNESARALGLDLGGRPLRRTQMSAAERLKILHSLAQALESKDPYTHGHSTRVEHIAVRTAGELGMSEREMKDLATAASLHDVGKIRIPTRVLRKPSELTLEEQLIVQEHSSVGAWMVSGVSNRRVVMSVRHHHERWDGNGYPDGVGGRDIPLFARIIAVADSFDAMTSNRPYRHGLSKQAALDEIRREAGSQFDPVVVDAFLEAQPRRISVPSLLYPGLVGAALRRIGRWARRLGAAPTVETVAGGAIAAVVAASVFVPPAANPRETPGPEKSRPGVVESGRDDLQGWTDRVAGKALKRNKNVLPVTIDKATTGKHHVASSNGAGGGGEGTAGPGPSSPPGLTKSPGNPPESATVPPGGEPSSPLPEVDVIRVTGGPRGDPQPDKGRDCIDWPGRGGGIGNPLHCGS